METNTAIMARTDQSKLPEPGIIDRLSSLPDEIISHVLSFLPTKYAVGTAVLSKRWKDLWTRVSNLDFDNRLVFRDLASSHEVDNLAMEERRGLEFSRFVDRVLSQHRNLDSVRRFRLHVFVSETNCKVMQDCLDRRSLVFGSQVEEIDVMLLPRSGCPRCVWWLPESFYTLKNLKVVNLHHVLMDVDGSVSLPSLKFLLLKNAEIKNLQSLSRLISGCPGVESLHLENCRIVIELNEKDMLIASLPYLRNLSIIDWSYRCLCPIAIEAPNIEHLVLGEFVNLQFLGSSPLPCLHSAAVDSGLGYGDGRKCLLRLLTQISNAKEMCLEGYTLILLSHIEGVQLPVFPNLIHLTIKFAKTDWLILHSLLHSVPNLQSLDIMPMIDMMPMMCEEAEPTCTPQCLLSSLEEIKIKDFVPFKNDMKMIGYLLNAGAVLKKVGIHAFDGIAKTECKKLASLLNFPRVSSTCDLRLLLRGSEININIGDDEIYTDTEDEFGLNEEVEDEFGDEGEDDVA